MTVSIPLILPVFFYLRLGIQDPTSLHSVACAAALLLCVMCNEYRNCTVCTPRLCSPSESSCLWSYFCLSDEQKWSTSTTIEKYILLPNGVTDAAFLHAEQGKVYYCTPTRVVFPSKLPLNPCRSSCSWKLRRTVLRRNIDAIDPVTMQPRSPRPLPLSRRRGSGRTVGIAGARPA